MHKVTLIPGEGIGPEVTASALEVVATARVSIEWQTFLAGKAALEKYGNPLPERLFDSIRENKVALKL